MNATNVHVEFAEARPRDSVVGKGPLPTGNNRLKGVEADAKSQAGSAHSAATANKKLAEALSKSQLFQEYQRTFSTVTGLPLTLRGVESWQLAHHGHRRQNSFCALMSHANCARAACLQTQQCVCDGVNGVPCTKSCPFGIIETAVAVKIGQEIVAYLQTGQVFHKPPTPRQTHRALNRIQELGLGFDLHEAAARYQKTPVIRQDQYQATIRLLQFFASQLGTLANQIVLEQRNAEPAQILRARQFIETHYSEDFSLADVARQVGMCSFYFCKKFKQATGMNFTQYVSRVRIEKAKNLLLNPNYRIIEIAYEIGFQSLTHFNRTFKSVAGQSPTDYRHNLRRMEGSR